MLSPQRRTNVQKWTLMSTIKLFKTYPSSIDTVLWEKHIMLEEYTLMQYSHFYFSSRSHVLIFFPYLLSVWPCKIKLPGILPIVPTDISLMDCIKLIWWIYFLKTYHHVVTISRISLFKRFSQKFIEKWKDTNFKLLLPGRVLELWPLKE